MMIKNTKKHKLIFVIAVSLIMLLGSVSCVAASNVLNLGFEGAKVLCYGVTFTNSANPTTVYAIQSGQNGKVLAASKQAFGSSPSTVYNMELGWDSGTGAYNQYIKGIAPYSTTTWYPIPVAGAISITSSGLAQMPDLGTVVESNIQLQDLNAQGQPLSNQLLAMW